MDEDGGKREVRGVEGIGGTACYLPIACSAPSILRPASCVPRHISRVLRPPVPHPSPIPRASSINTVSGALFPKDSDLGRIRRLLELCEVLSSERMGRMSASDCVTWRWT